MLLLSSVKCMYVYLCTKEILLCENLSYRCYHYCKCAVKYTGCHWFGVLLQLFLLFILKKKYKTKSTLLLKHQPSLHLVKLKAPDFSNYQKGRKSKFTLIDSIYTDNTHGVPFKIKDLGEVQKKRNTVYVCFYTLFLKHTTRKFQKNGALM